MALLKLDYTIDDANPIVSGTSLLKVVIHKWQVDMNATTSHIIKKLACIDTIVIDLHSNIKKVNDMVKALVEELATRGETTQHLVINLFEGYKVASDKSSVSYIKRKQDDYNDTKSTLTSDTLMDLTTNYYNTLLEAGEWAQPSQEDEKIITLEAQVKKVQQPKPAQRPATPAKSGSNQQSSNKQGTSTNTSNAKPANQRNIEPAWMLVSPKDNEPKQKKVNQKQYWWCPRHSA